MILYISGKGGRESGVCVCVCVYSLAFDLALGALIEHPSTPAA